MNIKDLLSILLTLVCLFANCVTMYGVFRTKNKDDTEKDVKTETSLATINMKLDELSRNLTDISKKSDTSSANLIEVQKILIQVNSDIDSHSKELKEHAKTLDELSGKLEHLEKEILKYN